jgi:hypothetical protein
MFDASRPRLAATAARTPQARPFVDGAAGPAQVLFREVPVETADTASSVAVAARVSIARCDRFLQGLVLQNVVVAGGCSMLPGADQATLVHRLIPALSTSSTFRRRLLGAAEERANQGWPGRERHPGLAAQVRRLDRRLHVRLAGHLQLTQGTCAAAVVTPIASRTPTTSFIRYLAPSTLTQRRLCTSGGSRTESLIVHTTRFALAIQLAGRLRAARGSQMI